MKFSKLLLVCTIMALVGACFSSVYAQDNEAVDADTLLQPRTAENQGEDVKSTDSNAVHYGVDSTQEDVEKGIAAAKAENGDQATLAKKVKLAELMHQIRPTRVQVDSAIRRAAAGFPEGERQGFVNMMQSALNYNAIERISVDAMVDTYTLRELESMYEYYSKEEARTASAKTGSWAAVVQPEIIRMIDRAMMRLRTGE